MIGDITAGIRSTGLSLPDSYALALLSAVIPCAFVAGYSLIFYVPWPKAIRILASNVTAPFQAFVTLQDAKAILAGPDARAKAEGDHSSRSSAPPLWQTVILFSVALLETVAWIGISGYELVLASSGAVGSWQAIFAFLHTLPWLYATLVSVFRPVATPPWDLFCLYIVFFAMAIVRFATGLFRLSAFGIPFPGGWIVTGWILDIIAPLFGLVVVLCMPINLPDSEEEKEQIGKTISPEDYTTLFGWITFDWVSPLVWKGNNTTLKESDVWDLSPTNKSRAVFEKYRALKGSTLRNVIAANSFDLIMDGILSFVSIACSYLVPYLLKKILDAIADPSPENRSRAFLYATLSFGAGVLKAESDLLHLWNDRRASTRVRSELMAALYDKALRRKDYSGVATDKKANDKDTDKDKAKKEEEQSSTDTQADVGKIVQLMSGDVEKISLMAVFIYNAYTAPFEIAIALTLLYQLLGWSAFTGFALLVVAIPTNVFLSRFTFKLSKSLSAARDRRMAVLTEMITAIKFIKFFAWETQWIARIVKARQEELNLLIKSAVASLAFRLLWANVPVLVAIISFYIFVAQGHELTVSIAFTAIALFDMLRMPLNFLPYIIIRILETSVSMARIDSFLKEGEVPDYVSSLKRPVVDPSEPVDLRLGAEDATFKWNENEKKKDEDKKAPDVTASNNGTHEERDVFELADISVEFPPGKLTMVTGPTASGKTALLMAILGEMTLIRGKIHLPKNPTQVDEHGLRNCISYAAQTPWLEHQTIKENILFGSPLEDDRYDAVIDACALKPDFAILEDGDQTEIGARGVSLSGGQKARVALARAVYARTKHVLLDDPLAALDSHSARYVFEHLLQGPLMENRTVVLVTHHVELVLPGAYYVVRMLDGRIDTQGTTKELREKGILSKLVLEEGIPGEKKIQAEAKAVESAPSVEDGKDVKPNDIPGATEVKKPRQLIKDEARAEGRVEWRIYKSYLIASSLPVWMVNLSLLLVTQVLSVGEKYWIRLWGLHYDVDYQSIHGLLSASLRSLSNVDFSHSASHFQHILPTLPSVPQIGSLVGFQADAAGMISSGAATTLDSLPSASTHPYFYVGIYTAIGVGAANLQIFDGIAQYVASYSGSKKLFNQLLHTVVRAPVRWFDTTPSGRVLNRFSRDIQVIDGDVAFTMRASTAWVAAFIAAIITVSAVLPAFLIPAFFIGYTYFKLTQGYLNTGRDLRRMESNSKSPIFSGFAELLEGITTVRAFSAEQRFFDSLHEKIDLTTNMFWCTWMLNRWLLVRFDSLGALAVYLTTVIALSGWVDAGWAGLTITSAMSFTMAVYWTCRMVTQLEMDLNSVERVIEYCDLPAEPAQIIESNRPPAFWPSHSESSSFIVVEDLVIKYSPELPAVLHELNFKIAAREKIGLLGRTGSGKSTLAMAFLRFVDPAEGRIIVDGIDISKIGLHDLRSRITYIPQDAVLFSGSIRDNLDPFNEHTDEECYDALRRVHLISESRDASRRSSRVSSRAASPTRGEGEASSTASVTVVPEDRTNVTLESQVSAGGSNFSQGQRQLIALARALLRRSSLIIMDEATASVDFETDAKIQAAIRDEFKDSLLLTIAHRIRTIIDYDRLLVLDAGKLAEFDTPYALLQKETGIFKEMCLKSGMYKELTEAAERKEKGLSETTVGEAGTGAE